MGATGWLGAAGDLDLAIAIRTALVRPGRLSVSVGSGIVADSEPEADSPKRKRRPGLFRRSAVLVFDAGCPPRTRSAGFRADGRRPCRRSRSRACRRVRRPGSRRTPVPPARCRRSRGWARQPDSLAWCWCCNTASGWSPQCKPGRWAGSWCTGSRGRPAGCNSFPASCRCPGRFGAHRIINRGATVRFGLGHLPARARTDGVRAATIATRIVSVLAMQPFACAGGSSFGVRSGQGATPALPPAPAVPAEPPVPVVPAVPPVPAVVPLVPEVPVRRRPPPGVAVTLPHPAVIPMARIVTQPIPKNVRMLILRLGGPATTLRRVANGQSAQAPAGVEVPRRRTQNDHDR